MTTFLRVPDKIEQLSEGEVQRYFIRPLLPSLFLIIGMVLIWFGGWELEVSKSESLLMTIFGVITILISIIILFRNRSYFIIKSSMSRIKPVRVNLDTLHHQDAVDLISQNKINEILKFKTHGNSPLSLELWYNKKHNKVYTQLFYYYDAGMRPVSLVHVSSLLDLDLSLI